MVIDGSVVENALLRNLLLLIIPCHCVLRIDGEMCGFSAHGGISFKKRMLTLEQKTVET